MGSQFRNAFPCFWGCLFMFHNISFDISIWFVGFCASNRSPHGKPDNWGSGAAIPSPHYRVHKLEYWVLRKRGHQDIHPLALTPTLLLQSDGSNPETGAQLFSFGKQGIKVSLLFFLLKNITINQTLEKRLVCILSLFLITKIWLFYQEPNADEVAKGDAGLQVPDLNIT